MEWDLFSNFPLEGLGFLVSQILPAYCLTERFTMKDDYENTTRQLDTMHKRLSLMDKTQRRDMCEIVLKMMYPSGEEAEFFKSVFCNDTINNVEVAGSTVDCVKVTAVRIPNSPGYLPPSINSDIDTWLVSKYCVDFDNPDRATHLVDSSENPPGYLRLCPTQASETQNCSEFKGKWFLSKDLVVPYGAGTGPAKTMAEDKPLKDTADYVYVIKCKGWPNVAKDWLHRNRTSGWPSRQIITETKAKMFCDICPAPSQNSDRPDLEWRFGFTRLENRLFQSLCIEQKQCMTITKLLLKKRLTAHGMFKSYMLKNVMFWVAEKIPQSFWFGSKGIGRGFLCLFDHLISFLCEHRIPHYIIPKRNLIDNVDHSFIRDILNELIAIRRHAHIFVLDLSNWNALSVNNYILPTTFGICRGAFLTFVTHYREAFKQKRAGQTSVAEMGVQLSILTAYLSDKHIDNAVGIINDMWKSSRISSGMASSNTNGAEFFREKIEPFLSMGVRFPLQSSKGLPYGLALLNTAMYCQTWDLTFYFTALNYLSPVNMPQMIMQMHIVRALLLRKNRQYVGALEEIERAVNMGMTASKTLLTVHYSWSKIFDNHLRREFDTRLNSFHGSPYYMACYLQIQLHVILNQRDEALLLVEHFKDALNEEVAWMRSNVKKPISSNKRYAQHLILLGYAYVWCSDFYNAFDTFTTIPKNQHFGCEMRRLLRAMLKLSQVRIQPLGWSDNPNAEFMWRAHHALRDNPVEEPCEWCGK